MPKRKKFIIPELKFGKVIGAIFGIWKKICLPITGLTVVSVVSSLFLMFWMIITTQINLFANPSLVALNVIFKGLILFILLTGIVVLYTIPLICTYKAAGDVCAGRPVSWRNIIKSSRKNVGRYFWGSLVLGILIALGSLAFIIPGIYIMLCTYLVFPVMFEEKKSFGDSWDRSDKLVKGIKFRILGYSILISLLVYMATLGFVGGLNIFSFSLGRLFDFIKSPDQYYQISFISSLFKNTNFFRLALQLLFTSVVPIFATVVYFIRLKQEKENPTNEKNKISDMDDLDTVREIMSENI